MIDNDHWFGWSETLKPKNGIVPTMYGKGYCSIDEINVVFAYNRHIKEELKVADIKFIGKEKDNDAGYMGIRIGTKEAEFLINQLSEFLKRSEESKILRDN